MAYIEQNWLDDGRIVIYRLSSVMEKTWDEWGRMVMENLETWPDDQPYLAVHELNAKGVGLTYAHSNHYDVFKVAITPRNQQEFEEMLVSRPNLYVRLAIIVSRELSGQVIFKKAIQLQNEDPNARVIGKVFYDEDAGINWLRGFLSD
ncbi:MAG: hypothetical protein DPW16_19550 [Chloroflexi bacterium]|nr:hypothetical protein [Chloroflexota bacterium]